VTPYSLRVIFPLWKQNKKRFASTISNHNSSRIPLQKIVAKKL